jgi:hypothetical protein
MKHILAVLVVFLFLPQAAEAKLYAKRPAKVIRCDARVTLGVAASPRHKGSRRVQVQIRDHNGKIFYKRTVRAPRGDSYEWKKTPRPCGERFTILYLFPKGKLEYKTRVRLGTANPPPPDDPTPTPTPKLDPTPEQPPPVIPIPSATPSSTPTPSPTPTPTPTPPPEETSTIRLQSGTETQLMRMVWWRGPPEIEGDHRVVGSCTWAPGGGNCVNGAPPSKFFRPQHFELIGFELWMDMPQYQGSAMTYSHYPIPVKLVQTGCTFQVQHGRAGGRQGGTLEFVDDPPGLEILPHTWTMTGDLCTTFDPLSTAWVSDLNAALATAIPPGPYIRPNYPY